MTGAGLGGDLAGACPGGGEAGRRLLRVRDLRVHFDLRRGLLSGLFRGREDTVRAVDGVDLDVDPGQIVALVGESGSGKSTTARAILRLVEPTGGSVRFGESDVLALRGPALRRYRRSAQIIFQDPYESLNPRQTVEAAVAEGLWVHGLAKNEAEKNRLVHQALNDAGLRPAEDYLGRYPHELSGGQRQRVVIAAALALDPRFIIADEPVSMLDVSIRADILKLLLDLRDKRGLGYILITHDLALAWLVSDRILAMYLGRVVEEGPAEDVVREPAHPYTRALLRVVPRPRRREGQRHLLRGETPDPAHIPGGCRFHPRCPEAEEVCRTEEPVYTSPGPGRRVACHHVRA